MKILNSKKIINLFLLTVFSTLFHFPEMAETRIGKALKRPRRLIATIAEPPTGALLSWNPTSPTSDFYFINPQTFTLTNTGGTAVTNLVFSLAYEPVVPFVGFNDSLASRFIIPSTTCGTSLGAGSSCTVVVEWRPCEGMCTTMEQATMDGLEASSTEYTTGTMLLYHTPPGAGPLPEEM